MKPSAGYTHRPASDSPRDIEAWGLTEAARRLMAAAQNPSDPEPLRQALSLNQRLWTIFQTSMAEDDCPLPRDLRENILRLSLIVDRQTFERLGDLDVTKLDQLIDINRNVAAGLSQRPAETAPAAGAQAPRPGTAPQPVAAMPARAPAMASAPVAPRPGMAAGGVGKFNISI
ncbi:MAG: flagellar biosynthesis regulator FlaF [Azospirillaceae bacterium]|nr:flagellar biosynthesis regulator FlaF [Azospirillaceae bacterium]